MGGRKWVSGTFQAEHGHFLSREMLQTRTVKVQSLRRHTRGWKRCNKDHRALLPVGAQGTRLVTISQGSLGAQGHFLGPKSHPGRRCFSEHGAVACSPLCTEQ